MSWLDKLQSVNDRHFPDAPPGGMIVCRTKGEAIFFYGIDEPLTPEVIADIINEVFPFLGDQIGRISDEVVSRKELTTDVSANKHYHAGT